MEEKKYDQTGGFSAVRVILSDALPSECFSVETEKKREKTSPSGEQGTS